MKKTTLFVIATILAVSSAFAQPSSGASANGDDRNFHFGLNFTPGLYFPSFTSVTTANNVSYTNNGGGVGFGYGYGVNLEFYFSHNYGIATGLEVTQFNVYYTNITDTLVNGVTAKSDNTVHQQTVQYLEIPALLKLRTNSIGLLKYFGQFGLGTGFLLSSTDNPTVTRTVTGLPPYPSVTTDNVNIYKQTDFIRLALVIGLGVEYNIAGTTSLQGSLNYDNAFTNVNSNGNNSVKMKGINLVIGVLF
ncbi:MAG: outer membrane beta-barrel protein [Bacteroidia bacterium]